MDVGGTYFAIAERFNELAELLEADRTGGQHQFKQLPFEVVGLATGQRLMEERLEEGLGNLLELEVVVDVEGMRLKVELYGVSDAPLLEELVAVGGEVVEGILQ